MIKTKMMYWRDSQLVRGFAIALVLLLANCGIAFSQANMVINPGFENYSVPTPSPTYFHSIEYATNWTNATNSCDLLHPSAGTSTGAFAQDYYPRNGVGCGRFFGTTAGGVGNDRKELMRGRTASLIAGQTYKVEFYVRRIAGVNVIPVGMHLSTNPFLAAYDPQNQSQTLTPQIEANIQGNQGEYFRVSGCYTATQSGVHYINGLTV